MIPKNKRHLIVNKEYSRLPYWTDEGYDDVQRSTSQKFVQDNYGKFDESENQLPYNDDDYQALEYQYQDQFHDPDVKTPPFNTENDPDRKPKDCLDFWNQLFPGHPTGSGPFIPDRGDLSALNIYAKKCPVEYKDHMCCGRGLRVQGPVNGELESEQNYKFGVGNKPRECDYNFWAKIGTMWNDGRYTAPYTETEITDTMGVTARGGWSLNKDCLTWKVKIKPKTDDCLGRIGPVIPQMEVSETQTLTIQGWRAGEVYYWSTTAGTIAPSEGLSVTFTAPATNDNCTNNATITLTCGGATVDTVHIAINANTADFTAYRTVVAVLPGTGCCTWSEYYPCNEKTCTGAGCGSATAITCTQYDCSGVMRTFSVWNLTCTHKVCIKFVGDTNFGFCTTPDYYYCGGNPGTYDMRTAAQKTAGCCPSALI